MCGRFANQYSWRELVELYRIAELYVSSISNLEPRFNFAPTDTGPVLRGARAATFPRIKRRSRWA